MRPKTGMPVAAACAIVLLLPGSAAAFGEGGERGSGPSGSTDGKGKVSAGVSQIRISQVKGAARASRATWRRSTQTGSLPPAGTSRSSRPRS